MCKVNTGYYGTSEIEHGLYACTVDNPLAKARGLSLRTRAQTMLYLLLNLKFLSANLKVEPLCIICVLDVFTTDYCAETSGIDPVYCISSIQGPVVQNL